MDEATLVITLTTDASRIDMAMEDDNVIGLLRERWDKVVCTIATDDDDD